MNGGGQASEGPPVRVCVPVSVCFFCSFSLFSEFSDKFDPFSWIRSDKEGIFGIAEERRYKNSLTEAAFT